MNPISFLANFWDHFKIEHPPLLEIYILNAQDLIFGVDLVDIFYINIVALSF